MLRLFVSIGQQDRTVTVLSITIIISVVHDIQRAQRDDMTNSKDSFYALRE